MPRRALGPLALLVVATLVSMPVRSSTGAEVQRRLDEDLSAGRPIVVHVVVALCDNANQGIVPVSAELGNGQSPGTNLYWGAQYGVKTHLSRQGWSRLRVSKPADTRILERVLLSRTLPRGSRQVPVYVLADAWDGASIAAALARFLALTTGDEVENLHVDHDELTAGGGAHLVAYVGHNGLMDFDLPAAPASSRNPHVARSAAVLACASKPYFQSRIERSGAHALLLTTGLMAPEAYTLEAAIRRWVAGGDAEEVRGAAAQAYDRYQHCGPSAARKLFWGGP